MILGVPVRVYTKTSPFEFVATPAASPRWRFGGSVSGVDASYGISGMFSCADRTPLSASVAVMTTRKTRVMNSSRRVRCAEPALHYRLDVVVVWRRRIFCTRHALISETISSSGLRQSMPCTVWNWPIALPARPNLPMIFPSSSIL